ncbi:MFS transporter [Colletotrichum scovillei]|uniref:Major facilitator superfamily transporter n=1 Tax=Colletotrichum scovillei TaxID=1209932 RepID=A0A9P7UAC7_9PEZI|nr:MFS transporter [Colletotrichum scovillei]KAF4773442.1 MFS transporter [Colletotrichum scovillei]KAG7048309.1 major facilitator superfamily transporter [Colletotrichum scovillei]KAG7065475.1 major facilitator superfamily transporter [Colletotrichum scovillei]KAG7068079.1 major facilitator superfamily transporter [Colletotrichum scovillei]
MSPPESLGDPLKKEWQSSEALANGSSLASSMKGSDDSTGTTESQEKTEPEPEADEPPYPTGVQLGLIVFALFCSVFIVAVSQTVLATAIPTITSVFNSSDDIAWYSTGEQITAVALQLPFGQAYSLFNNKWTFLTSVVIYLAGSAVCGSAPTSVALIIGRAIQGVGMAGVFGGSFIVIARITPLRKRSLFAGLFGAAYAIASVIGPIMGGAITQRASWRWCFYFNLPIGAVVVAVVIFCLPPSLCRTSAELRSMTPIQLAKKFDLLGTTHLLASLVCLMLALQWGGGEYPWKDARVIAVLVVFGVTLLPWMALQYFQEDDATVPLSIVKQRSVASSNLYLLFLNGAFGVFIFYLPVWFQSIRGDDAESSGLKQLALCISTAVGSIVAGGLVMAIGFYNPFVILGSLLVTAGSALLMTIKSDAALGILVGAQILVGAGVGVGAEQANVAVQTVLPNEKIPKGTSLTLFTRLLGVALSVPIAQSVFQQELSKNLGSAVAAKIYGDGGATQIKDNLQKIFGNGTAEYQNALDKVNTSLTRTFMLAMILAAISFLFAILLEWKNVKKEKRSFDDAKEQTSQPEK